MRILVFILYKGFKSICASIYYRMNESKINLCNV